MQPETARPLRKKDGGAQGGLCRCIQTDDVSENKQKKISKQSLNMSLVARFTGTYPRLNTRACNRCSSLLVVVLLVVVIVEVLV